MFACRNRNEAELKPIDTFLVDAIIKDRPHLKIKHTALNHSFLLYGSFIPMLNSPTGHTLKGRVVSFELYGDRVVMLESPIGHSIARNNESTILLAEFPVVRSDDDGVVVDFARGMNAAFTMRNVHSRSVSERDAMDGEKFRAVMLSASFIKSITEEKNIMTISQIAQWRNSKSEMMSAEFRYYFRDYVPSKTFKKTQAAPRRWVQYFSTPPMIEPPTTLTFAYNAKWHIDKPIVFYLSANTPPHYKEAITDGMLFWNHIFGKKIVEIRDLDPSLAAPNPHYNIVQWVPWDNEPSAYADMVLDPLTGEIMGAQIYVRSGWAVQSIPRLRNQLEEVTISEEKPAGSMPSVEEDVPLPSMFDNFETCEKTLSNFAESTDIMNSVVTISDETLKTLTGDILRAVVAHEMGHVLGLRHNLSASTTATISYKERDEVFKNYLRTGLYDLSFDKYLSTSIMDVFSAADDAIVGAHMRELMKTDKESSSRLATIYAFDKQAIDLAYFNKPMDDNLPFCSDEDIETFLDCRRWDAGSLPMLYSSTRANLIMAQVGTVLADAFVAAINPKRQGGPARIEDLTLTTLGILKIADENTKELFAWFNGNSRSVQIESKFPALGPHNRKEIMEEKFKFLRKQLEENGVEKTLFGLLPPFHDKKTGIARAMSAFAAHFDARVRELARETAGFTFSDEDRAKADEIARAFMGTLFDELINQTINILARSQFDDPELQIPVENALYKIARQIILETANNNSPPAFSYELKTRELAALLMSPAIGILPDWSWDSTNSITTALKQIMNNHTTTSSNSVDLNKLTREHRQWLLEQNRLLNTLVQIRSVSRKLNPPPRTKSQPKDPPAE